MKSYNDKMQKTKRLRNKLKLNNYRKSGRSFIVRYIETTKELEALSEIDSKYFGNANISYSKLYEWWLSDKYAIVALFLENEIYGAMGIFPITKRWINQFYNGKVGEASLDEKTIKKAKIIPCADWYISGIVVKDVVKNPFAFPHLLIESTKYWIMNRQIKYPANLWAIATSKEGENLLTRFDFHLERPSNHVYDHFPLYKRTFDFDDIKIIIGE
jgi:hypothetical protein